MAIRIVDRYLMTVDRFWDDLFFDETFTAGLYRDGLGFDGYDLISETIDPNGNRQRTIKVFPRLDMPGPVKRLLGNRFYYLETGRYDAARKRWVADMSIPKVGTRLSLRTTMWLESRGDEESDRYAEIEVNVKVFGLKKIFERFAEKSLREGYVNATRFTNEYGPSSAP